MQRGTGRLAQAALRQCTSSSWGPLWQQQLRALAPCVTSGPADLALAASPGAGAAALATQAAPHQQQQGGPSAGSFFSAAAAAAAAAAGVAAAAAAAAWPRPAHCIGWPGAAQATQQHQNGGGGDGGWLPGWVPWLLGGSSGGGGGGASQQAQRAADFLGAIREDPRVAVVLAFALPFLSLSFGYTPSQREMASAAAAVEAHLHHFRPWEVAVLLWGGARLGYFPSKKVAAKLVERVRQALAERPGSPDGFTPQEAAMVAWALSVLQLLTPDLWRSLLGLLARCDPGTLDEVTLLHLYQAAMFADRAAVTAPDNPAPGGAGVAAEILPRLRSPAEEVRATLAAGGAPLALMARCEGEYTAAAAQAGFDGPFLIELTMLRTLVSVFQELGEGAAYQQFQDMSAVDLQRARQLLADPFLLAKFKSEIADRRAQANNFTRQLADVSRTLRDLGLHHVLQSAVEDGLVHVDIALPDYKVAFFLEGAAPSKVGGAAGSGGGGASAPLLLHTLDREGAVLKGYVANETAGTKAAKLRLLQRLGWVVLPLTWGDNVRGDAEKRRLLLQQLDRAGGQQLMRGRVSSMLHGAMRGAEESKLGRERYGDRGSAGQYITRQQH